MKFKLTSITAAVLLASSSQLWAAKTEVDQRELLHEMQILISRTQQLEKQVDSLTHEVKVLKKNGAKAKPISSKPHPRSAVHAKKESVPPASAVTHVNGTTVTKLPYKTEYLRVHAVEGKPKSRFWQHYPNAVLAGDKVITYIVGMPVVTSPYLGENPAYDASDLIVNISKTYQDLRLLEQRSKLEAYFKELDYPKPDTPFILISGKVEPFGFITRPYIGDTTGDIDVDSSELDVATIISSWVESMISFGFNTAPPLQGGERVANSNIFMDKAYVNIGNLNSTPFYMSAGQLYVPYGRYSSFMVSAPLTLIEGRTKVRPILLGYRHMGDTGFYGSVFGFRSDVDLGKSGAGGANVGYNFGNAVVNADFGASFITSVDDAQGYQSVPGNGTFNGFGVDSSTEMVNKIPGLNLHGALNLGSFSFLGEYVTALQDFAVEDLSFNNSGAQPSALNLEGAYTFRFLNKPSAFAIGYGLSEEALALMIPHQRFIAAFNISWWRDTIESLEFRHDIDYSSDDIASGIGATVSTIGTGKSSNTLTAQIGVYF